MTTIEARARLETLARRWRYRQSIGLCLRTVAIALPLIAATLATTPGLAHRPRVLFGVLLGALTLGAIGAWRLPRPRRANAGLMARHLDRAVPELEESTTLLLNDSLLTDLGRLQQARTLHVFAGVDSRRVLVPRLWLGGAGEALAGLLTAAVVLVIAARLDTPAVASSTRPPISATSATDPLSTLDISIVPPAYTGREARSQRDLDLQVEEGALVTWRLPADDGLEVALVAGDGEQQRFEQHEDELRLSRTAAASFAYRLRVERSGIEVGGTAFARFETRLDAPPLIAIVVPVERLTLLDPSTAALDLEIRARDDYGLDEAHLVTTLALGLGELVEFRERRIPLNDPKGSPTATFEHRFDLRELGAGPSAELYFHVEASDRRRPKPNRGRSPTTIVRVLGDEIATASLGEGLPVILPPTYFRSQRQIIIDTEKLLADSPDLLPEEVRRRSEALGHDQRALRMRHGALLGEEFVSGQAIEAGAPEVDHEEAEDHTPEPEIGEPVKVDSVFDVLPEGLFHAHDSGEISTYFTSQTRTMLKRVLARMWEAEGRLRVVDPEGALPFEYQALELLKELQEASRIYVQRIGFDAPPLDSDRRLTGELDEVVTRHRQPALAPRPQDEAAARALLALFSSHAPDDLPTDSLESAAEAASNLRAPIAHLAAASPGAVAALNALDALASSRRPTTVDRRELEGILWSLLPQPDPALRSPTAATDSLSSLYRDLAAEEDSP